MAVVAILFLALLYYVWVGATSYPITFSGEGLGPPSASAPGLARGAYNLLASALLHGHLYLPIKPDARFLHLAHPYLDGGRIEAKKYHDLVWHRGHFYSAWGPAPVVIFLLVHLLSFGSIAMSQTLAVVIYSFVGLICSVAILQLLIERLLPRTPSWFMLAATAGMALMNVAPFILRRPAQYEVAISGAYAFEMLGLWLLACAAWSRGRWRLKLALASCCLGLAVASRPTMLTGGLLLIAASAWMLRNGRDRRQLLVSAGAPFVVCLLMLGAYNALRFGSPLNLGYSYQLAAPPVDGRQINDPSYLLPGLFGYLLMPPRLSVGFPYISLLSETQSIYPLTLPPAYAGGSGGWPLETAGGLLPTIPFVLLLFGLPSLWIRRDANTHAATVLATLVAAAGAVALLLVATGMWLTTERYELDFVEYFLIAAFLTWAALIHRLSASRRARKGVVAGGGVLALVSMIVGLAISMTGEFNLLETEHPSVFNSLADISSPLPTAVAQLANKPMIASISGPYVQVPTDLGPFDLQEAGATVTLARRPTSFTLVAPSAATYFLDGNVVLQPGAPLGAGAAVRVTGPGSRSYLVHRPDVARMRVPLSLHRGVNRVSLTLGGTATKKLFFVLAGIDLDR